MCSRIPFKAIRGGGAFLNGKPISVSSAPEIGQAVVSTNIGYGRSREVTDFMLGNVRVLLEHNVRGLRMTGSGTAPSTPHGSLWGLLELSLLLLRRLGIAAATLMCDVAMGRLDCYFEWGVHAWDVSAASIIIEEAGGVCISPTATSAVTDQLNLTARSMLCGPKAIVEALFPILNKGWSAEWK
jgi:fructose-1,6-bisphosphatase/inositol monophosphatase family enzyme